MAESLGSPGSPGSPGSRPRVVLVDDHRLFRSGVRAELGDAVDLVGEAETVAEAVSVIRTTKPDVVLLDVHMPDGGGQAVLAGVGEDAPGTRFLALSVSDAAEDVIGVIRAGARGYVTKSISGPELAAHPDRIEVLGEAADVDEAVAAVVRLHPEVVLLDVHLPGGGGAEVMRRVGSRSPGTRFLALSVSDAAEDVIGTIRSGARGYVTKTITGPELVSAVDRVAGGDAVFSPRLAGFVLDAFAGSIEVAQVDEDLDRLTEREREVMRLIARGYAYKEVAGELFISVKTVETHVSSVLRKLQLSSRHELTRWANDRRLL